MRLLRLTLAACLLTAGTALAAPPPAAVPGMDHVRAAGDVAADKGVVTARGAATLVLGADNAATYRLTAEVKPADRATRVLLYLMPADPADVTKPAALYASFYRDATGLQLQADASLWDAEKQQWGRDGVTTWYTYWPAPADKARLALMEGSGLAPRSLKDRWLKLRIEADRRHLRFWLDGLLVRQVERPPGAKGPVTMVLAQGDQVRNVAVAPLAESVYLPVDLTPFAHDRPAVPLGKESLAVGGVPFELAAGGNGLIDLHHARWIEQKQDPVDTYENYEGGPPVVHDPRMPLLRVPATDYVAVHVLAQADDDPATTANFTLRAGRYGYSDQVVFHSFPATAPRKASPPIGMGGLQTPAGPFFHVRVPLTEAFAQDLSPWMEMELTKEVRLARRVPDPNRTRARPLGLPSGVRIAALTLERSPLQMRVTSKETGHAFVVPQQPTFDVRLTNITGAEQPYELELALTHHDGTPLRANRKGSVPAGQSADVALEVAGAKLGYHDVTVTLKDGAGRTLLQRRTSCCLLPPDTRKHRETSPLGTWDFCGAHFTANDPDAVGPLYVKLGLRWGMAHFKPEKRKQYGVLPGAEPQLYPAGPQAWEDWLKSTPDQPPLALVFHETAISYKHLLRVPELFTDQPPYKFDADEEKAFKKMYDGAVKAAREMKAKYPRVHLRLGNGAPPTKEALYQARFPAELFDSAGNESPALGRPPEAQPPDYVAYNASIWMDRQLLDAYGYKDKPVTMCYESCYTSSMPGKEQEQADYYVRHALHALAWEIPEIKIGQICDMGNGFYFSIYGPIGLCRSRPELNVKPAFVALATLTRVLDGAKFARVVPLGSPALYGLEFTRPDGTQAHAFWTLRGKRSVRLLMDRPGAWTLVNDQGSETPLPGPQGIVELELTPAPVYLVGAGKVEGAGPRTTGPGGPQYADKPAGKATVLAPLSDLADWTVETERDPELEYYDFVGPRRKGDFAFVPVASFEGKEKVLRVTPRPLTPFPSPPGGEGKGVRGKETMPMYAVLTHKKGIPVPGTPTEVGAWVNGNGGWGRLIFELTDASGQGWISIGAEQPGVPRKWVEDLVPPDMRAKWAKPAINDSNTDDVLGLSRINFDGWRWLAFPLPGNYPGEQHPWPANSQWRWDKDGVVHYPLTFRRLIVELPEKVLHVKTFAPPPRPEIYLKDLGVGQDERQLGYVLGPDR
jgi:hypothetical protein